MARAASPNKADCASQIVKARAKIKVWASEAVIPLPSEQERHPHVRELPEKSGRTWLLIGTSLKGLSQSNVDIKKDLVLVRLQVLPGKSRHG
jgi:hypothetical protein